MSRYHELLGRRVEVQYQAGDVILPALGVLAADSGKSIFLEEKLFQKGQAKSFRWEIPYACILSLEESFAPAPVAPKAEPAEDADREGARPSFAQLRHRIHEA